MGRPLGSKNKNVVPLEKRLYSTSILNTETGCWEKEPTKKSRYPNITINGKMQRAHRVSYELYTRKPIPKGLCCLHKCDNPKCINPAHLFLGTHQENMTDMIKKGRDKKDGPKGTRCAQHILTEKQVIEIKKKLKQIAHIKKTPERAALGKQYNVSEAVIYHIDNNRTWKHIEV